MLRCSPPLRPLHASAPEARYPRLEQRLRDETAAAIEAALDETAYAEASAEGAALNLNAAVAAARALAVVR